MRVRCPHRFTRKYNFHTISGEATSSQRYIQPEPLTKTNETLTDWHLTLTITTDDGVIEQAQKPLGKYIFATNVLDEQTLSTEDLLTLYKDQNCSVERGFRFLKDLMFFADSLFLKKPARIMALLMVMGLRLLIYALAEHHLRQQLVEQHQTISSQKGKPIQNPTMRRVFQMFEGHHPNRTLSTAHSHQCQRGTFGTDVNHIWILIHPSIIWVG